MRIWFASLARSNAYAAIDRSRRNKLAILFKRPHENQTDRPTAVFINFLTSLRKYTIDTRFSRNKFNYFHELVRREQTTVSFKVRQFKSLFNLPSLWTARTMTADLRRFNSAFSKTYNYPMLVRSRSVKIIQKFTITRRKIYLESSGCSLLPSTNVKLAKL